MTEAITRKRKNPETKQEEFDPRWTLNMEFEHHGLLRKNQWKKLPPEERKKYKRVRLKWGKETHSTERHRVIGYKLKGSK